MPGLVDLRRVVAVRLAIEHAEREQRAQLAAHVLVDARGALAGVIDFGGLGVGDPAVDLLYAWDLFDAQGRAVFARAAGADEAMWARSRAWAFAGPGLLTLANYRDTMPERTARLTRMVEAVATDVGVALR